MRKIGLFFIVIFSALIYSCYTQQSEHQMYVSNQSDVCIRVFVGGSEFGTVDKILMPDGVTINNTDDFVCFYRTSLDEDSPVVFSQDKFNSEIDSFSVFIRDGSVWNEKYIPEFWDLDNWSITFMDENVVTYFFRISDSLLNF